MKTISVNSTEVKVEETKEKMTNVTIATEDADIYVNGTLVWSKYDGKEEYKKIPPALRSFVEAGNDHLEFNSTKNVTEADCWRKDKTVGAFFSIPANNRKKLVIRLDYVMDFNVLEHDYIRNNKLIDQQTADSLVKEFNELHEQITKKVEEAGYRLTPSHGSGDGLSHGWWDITLPVKDWDEDKFVRIWELFSRFDKRLNQVAKEYNM